MISVHTFIFNTFQVNTYLLYDDTGEAIIIDPACDSAEEFNQLKNYIEEHQLSLQRIINTHGHIDHIAGVQRVVDYFNVPFEIHPDDVFLLKVAPQSAQVFGFELETAKMPDGKIEEGKAVTFGNSTLKTLHVPGHSPGSIVFYCKESKFAVVGDVLFSGSIGRTDLPGGDYETLISCIKTKLLTLPRDTKVFSGHGPSTTIQQEHDTNPFLI